jgi:hypothetical protein
MVVPFNVQPGRVIDTHTDPIHTYQKVLFEFKNHVSAFLINMFVTDTISDTQCFPV